MADANTGTAAPDSQQQDTNDDATPVTLGQLRALFGEWTAAQRTENARAMNAAITNRLRAVKATESAQEPAQTQPAEPQGASVQKPVDPELAKIRAQLEEIRAENERVKRESAEQLANARRKDNDAALRTALMAKGVTETRANAAIALYRMNNAIVDDPEVGFMWTIPFAQTRGAKPEPVQFTSLNDAVEAWAKTPEAADFLPAAAPAANPGPRVGAQPQNNGTTPSQRAAIAAVEKLFG